MAITTATELRAAVLTWLADSSLSDYADDFIVLAEGFLNRELRHRKMETIADLTPSSGVCTLPDDYLSYIRVVEKASPRRELKAISPQAVDQLYSTRPSGLSLHFSITGDSLRMFPVSANDIELTYIQKIPSLSENETNWLLDANPGLYLSACRMMALDFKNEVDSPRMQAMTAMTRQHIDNMNNESDMAKYAKAQRILAGATP